MKRAVLISVILIAGIMFSGFYFSAGSTIGNVNTIKNQLDNDYQSKSPVEKQFNVNPGERLLVDIKTGADIIIEGWNKNTVDIKAQFRGRDADDIELTIEKESYGVSIKAEYEDYSNSRKTSGKIVVKVPSKFDLELSTMGGEIELTGIEGSLEGSTMGGELILKNLKGTIDLSTMGGEVELRDSEVDGELSTMGGDVYVTNVTGDVDASTMGGRVTQRNVKSKKGGTEGKEVKVSSMGGDIDLDEVLNGAKVSTMGGDITIYKVSKFLEAETMGGDIDISKLDGWIEAETMGGDVTVEMVGNPKEGRRDVELTSMGGDIELTVPDGLDMDIHIEIIYKTKHKNKVQIISDFDLDEKIEEVRGNDWGWDDKEKLVAVGKTGSGKNRVIIKTFSGKVHLKKS